MIPVIVREKNRDIAPVRSNRFTQADDAGAGVEDEESIGRLVEDLDAGGVAAVADGRRGRVRHRAAHAEEPHPHEGRSLLRGEQCSKAPIGFAQPRRELPHQRKGMCRIVGERLLERLARHPPGPSVGDGDNGRRAGLAEQHAHLAEPLARTESAEDDVWADRAPIAERTAGLKDTLDGLARRLATAPADRNNAIRYARAITDDAERIANGG